MLQLISRPDFARRIIAQYAVFLPTAQVPAELFFAPISEFLEGTERPNQRVQYLVYNTQYLNRIQHENSILNVQLSLHFPSVVTEKTLREVKEQSTRILQNTVTERTLREVREHTAKHLRLSEETHALNGMPVLTQASSLKKREESSSVASSPMPITLLHQQENAAPEAAKKEPSSARKAAIQAEPFAARISHRIELTSAVHHHRTTAALGAGSPHGQGEVAEAPVTSTSIPLSFSVLHSTGNREDSPAGNLSSASTQQSFGQNMRAPQMWSDGARQAVWQSQTLVNAYFKEHLPPSSGTLTREGSPPVQAKPAPNTPSIRELPHSPNHGEISPQLAPTAERTENPASLTPLFHTQPSSTKRHERPSVAFEPRAFAVPATRAHRQSMTEQVTADSLPRVELGSTNPPAAFVPALRELAADAQNPTQEARTEPSRRAQTLERKTAPHPPKTIPLQARNLQRSDTRLLARTHPTDPASSFHSAPSSALTARQTMRGMAPEAQASVVADSQLTHPSVKRGTPIGRIPTLGASMDMARALGATGNTAPTAIPPRASYGEHPAMSAPATVVYYKEPSPAPSEASTPAPSFSEDIAFIKKTVSAPVQKGQASTKNMAVNMPVNATVAPSSPQNMEQQISAIADKVYSALERRLRSERMRKGLF